MRNPRRNRVFESVPGRPRPLSYASVLRLAGAAMRALYLLLDPAKRLTKAGRSWATAAKGRNRSTVYERGCPRRELTIALSQKPRSPLPPGVPRREHRFCSPPGGIGDGRRRFIRSPRVVFLFAPGLTGRFSVGPRYDDCAGSTAVFCIRRCFFIGLLLRSSRCPAAPVLSGQHLCALC